MAPVVYHHDMLERRRGFHDPGVSLGVKHHNLQCATRWPTRTRALACINESRPIATYTTLSHRLLVPILRECYVPTGCSLRAPFNSGAIRPNGNLRMEAVTQAHKIFRDERELVPCPTAFNVTMGNSAGVVLPGRPPHPPA